VRHAKKKTLRTSQKCLHSLFLHSFCSIFSVPSFLFLLFAVIPFSSLPSFLFLPCRHSFFFLAVIPFSSLPSFPRKREPIFNNPPALTSFNFIAFIPFSFCRHSIFFFTLIPFSSFCRHSRESGNPFSTTLPLRIIDSNSRTYVTARFLVLAACFL